MLFEQPPWRDLGIQFGHYFTCKTSCKDASFQPPCVGWGTAGDLQEDLIRAGAALVAPEGAAEGGRKEKQVGEEEEGGRREGE